MLYKLSKYVFTLLCILAMNSCSDDLSIPTVDSSSGSEAELLPIEITVSLPNIPDTRSFDDAKKYFEKGELIHITAEFQCLNNGESYTVKQYGVMKYADNGQWTSFNDDTALYWPGDAEKATFSAYYINGSNGVLSGNTMEPKLLTDYTYSNDPLEAHVIDLPYGHTIGFNFTHLFAHLTLYDLKQGISDRFWLTRQEDGRENQLNNAFYFEYDPVNKEVKPIFTSIPDDKYNGLVYLSGNYELVERDEEETGQVSMFVEPGIYDSFQVRYPRTSSQAATYLTYRNSTGVGNQLEGNGRYEFSVLRSLGIIILEKPGTGWDENTDPRAIIDVESFLKAINAGTDYFEEDPETGEMVQFLLATDSGTELLTNVDFRNEYYTIFPPKDGYPEFTPDLSKTFDGGFHYIYNLGCPLFNDNTGIIKNLGIKGADTQQVLQSNETFEVNGHPVDFSRQGLIARINHGTVNNMRISDLKMKVEVKTSRDNFSQEAHNVALLFGSNMGYIFDINYSGESYLQVKEADGQEILPQISIAGVAGQNLGYIYNISPLDSGSAQIKIENECKGSAAVYYIGGVAGNNTGSIYDVLLPDLILDSSTSEGQHAYLGGIAGRVAESTTNHPTISSAVVKGSLKCGKCSEYMGIVPNAYTGGLVGYMNIQGNISNCSTACSIEGPSQLYSPNAIYATGGAFGRINRTLGINEGLIETTAAFGNTLTGSGYIGCFAGIIPHDMSWQDYNSNQVNVKKFDNIEYIGASMD